MTPRSRRQRLNSIQEIAEKFRQSDDVAAPDLTSSILDQVDLQRPFLDSRTRRMIWVGRAAVAASVAMVVLAVALMHRLAPESIELVSRPAPLSNVVETVKSEANEKLGELRTVVTRSPGSTGGRVAPESGGLLTLVSSAASRGDSLASSPCSFCGPVMPPSDAARSVPCRRDCDADAVVTLSSFKTSAASPLLGPGPVTARIRTEAREAARLGLNGLAPLGAGPAADSALAPK